MQGVLGAFHELDSAVHAIEDLQEAERSATSPSTRRRRATSSSTCSSRRTSAVRVFTLIGGLLGVTFGYWIPIWISDYWPLVVGGKPIASWVPYTIIGFEVMVLIGALVDGVRHVRRRRAFRASR